MKPLSCRPIAAQGCGMDANYEKDATDKNKIRNA